MSTATAFDRLAELDRRNVVDVDLGSDTFKANAHRHMAEWARRRPFYVLGNGPPQVASAATPTCIAYFLTPIFSSPRCRAARAGSSSIR